MSGVNPHRYQYEKIGAAILFLMLPDSAFEQNLAGAMAEFALAFGTTPPSDPARPHVETIKQIMRGEPYEHRAAALTATDRVEIVTAFWELDRTVSREYHTYEARR